MLICPWTSFPTWACAALVTAGWQSVVFIQNVKRQLICVFGRIRDEKKRYYAWTYDLNL